MGSFYSFDKLENHNANHIMSVWFNRVVDKRSEKQNNSTTNCVNDFFSFYCCELRWTEQTTMKFHFNKQTNERTETVKNAYIFDDDNSIKNSLITIIGLSSDSSVIHDMTSTTTMVMMCWAKQRKISYRSNVKLFFLSLHERWISMWWYHCCCYRCCCCCRSLFCGFSFQ